MTTIEQAFLEALEFIEDQEDVVDGSDGAQQANTAMRIAQTMRAALAAQPSQPQDVLSVGDRLWSATTRLMATLHVERITEDERDKAEPDLAPALNTALSSAHEFTATAWRECVNALGSWAELQSAQPSQPQDAKDATRYRWLRKSNGPWNSWARMQMGEPRLDEAIDAAMEKT